MQRGTDPVLCTACENCKTWTVLHCLPGYENGASLVLHSFGVSDLFFLCGADFAGSLFYSVRKLRMLQRCALWCDIIFSSGQSFAGSKNKRLHGADFLHFCADFGIIICVRSAAIKLGVSVTGRPLFCVPFCKGLCISSVQLRVGQGLSARL